MAFVAPIAPQQDQRQLEARYEKLIAQRSTLKGLANKSRYKEARFHVVGVNKRGTKFFPNYFYGLASKLRRAI